MSQTNVTIVELKALKFWLAKSKKIEVNPNTSPNLKYKSVVKNGKYSNSLFFRFKPTLSGRTFCGAYCTTSYGLYVLVKVYGSRSTVKKRF
jgi:hypothetical protein